MAKELLMSSGVVFRHLDSNIANLAFLSDHAENVR